MEKKENQAEETAIVKSEITGQVLSRVNTFTECGELKLPSDYSPENALKGAMLVLEQTKTRDGKPVLEVCNRASIANALLEMVVTGLSVIKKQGYFIPYGGQLDWSRSYQGSIALARRVGGVKDVKARIVYEEDDFKYSIDPETGYSKLIKHEQSLNNISNDKIKGAYAVVMYEDGRSDIEIMTLDEIKQAWAQGATKGNSPAHQKFSQEMCKKTVINRACKTPINSSSDITITDLGGPKDKETQVNSEIVEETSTEEVDFVEVNESPEADFVEETDEQRQARELEELDNTEERPEIELDFGNDENQGPGF